MLPCPSIGLGLLHTSSEDAITRIGTSTYPIPVAAHRLSIYVADRGTAPWDREGNIVHGREMGVEYLRLGLRLHRRVRIHEVLKIGVERFRWRIGCVRWISACLKSLMGR